MNVADRLRDSAARRGDRTAVLFGGRAVSYAELDAAVDRVAARLQAAGLQPGDRVSLLLPNSLAFAEAIYGALRAGLVAVPVNTALTAAETGHILTDSGTRAVIGSRTAAEVLDRMGCDLPLVDPFQWRQSDAAGPRPVDLDDDALAVLQYTSGTTGRPKGAMLLHRNLLANQDQMAGTRLALADDDVVLAALPLFHIYALNVGLLHTLARGATVLIVERFDPVQTLADIGRHRVSVLLGAPPIYVAWLGLDDLADRDLSSLRLALSGAAPLPPAVLRRFTDTVGIPIWEGYGLTETAPVLTSSAMADRPRPGSVGQPLPGVELRLVDDHGLPVRQGDPGEVVVRGPNVFAGYWKDQAATDAVFDADGWFHTGDIGYAEEGHLYLVDRSSDLIIVSGFNVYPREVEDVLVRHPQVAEAAVVGAPHPHTGECVKAFVVLREGADAGADELVAHCRRSLARFKCPDVVEFTDALPHLPTGKVRRRDLRS